MVKKIGLKKIQDKASKALKQATKHLEEIGREVKILAKRGEGELARLSKMGRAQLGILALSVKKEQLYRQIGMKVWQLSTKGKLTTEKLKLFCKELSDINKKVKSRKRAINRALKKR